MASIMDALWIGIAFVLGLAARQVTLPPLVGYLAAGFILFALGVNPGPVLDQFAATGITLLLFTIGLKLRPDMLFHRRVWAVTGIHMVVVTLFIAGAAVLAGRLLPGFGTSVMSALVLAFALSFSSTVFAVKVLEDRGEVASTYGRTAVGILIVQDIAAVVFLASAAARLPTWWALLLVPALVPLRWLLLRIMDRTGHDELLVLFGLVVALGGAQAFDVVGLKGDLGALIFGLMLSSHRWSERLAGALLSFKDLFLVGFFLGIGLHGIPGPEALAIAVLLLFLIPVKSVLFFWLLARFRMRARTAFLAALNLSNYSEFGLVVVALACANGWLPQEWLTILAVSLALSFIVASPVNGMAHRLYESYRNSLVRFQHPTRLPEESEIDPGDASVLIFGMGRVGTGAYEVLHRHRGERVIGIDMVPEVIEQHRSAGRRVIRASATDPDFWSRIRLNSGRLHLVMLAMPRCEENIFAATQLRKRSFTGRIAALAKYEEDVARLQNVGVHSVFNLYAEAGAGFAADAYLGVKPLEIPEGPG